MIKPPSTLYCNFDKISNHLDLIGECARGEAASNGCASSGRGKFKHSTLPIGSSRDHTHISRVLNGSNGTGSQEKFLPGLSQIDDVGAYYEDK